MLVFDIILIALNVGLIAINLRSNNSTFARHITADRWAIGIVLVNRAAFVDIVLCRAKIQNSQQMPSDRRN